jgi:hypothetical protein
MRALGGRSERGWPSAGPSPDATLDGVPGSEGAGFLSSISKTKLVPKLLLMHIILSTRLYLS